MKIWLWALANPHSNYLPKDTVLYVQGVSKIIDHKQVRASADEWKNPAALVKMQPETRTVQKAFTRRHSYQKTGRSILGPQSFERQLFCAHCGPAFTGRKQSAEILKVKCLWLCSPQP